MKNLLINSGYIQDAATGVWSRTDFESIRYSDGDIIEQRLQSIIDDATDVSVFSPELALHIDDWPTEYHLSAQRANILRPFAHILNGAKVLEIGAGCGAITRYLGEVGAEVLALEGSVRRAEIARSRTRDLDSVQVLSEKFSNFNSSEKFDVITLIGVLEYANIFSDGIDPFHTMLAQVGDMLSDNGCLIVAIENQLGLKYFAGAPEDHLGIDMYGVEGRYLNNQPQTFGRIELTEKMKAAGFCQTDLYAPFPDYKLPSSIVAEAGFRHPHFAGEALATENVKNDPQLPKILNFSPELVWPTLRENGLAMDLSNSLLIAAHKNKKVNHDAHILAYHYSTQRIEQYCKQTTFETQEGVENIVVRRKLLGHQAVRTEATDVDFEFYNQEPYIHGKTLLSNIQCLASRDGWSAQVLAKELVSALNIARGLLDKDEKFDCLVSIDYQLPGEFFDLTPQNIVQDQNENFHVIDREWRLNVPFSTGWYIFRTLLLLVQSMTRFGQPAHGVRQSRADFFIEVFSALGFQVNRDQLNAFARKEAQIQSHVTGRSTEHHANWWSDSSLPYDTRHTLIKSFSDSEMAELRSQLVTAHAATEVVEQRASDLASQVAELEQQLVREQGISNTAYTNLQHNYGQLKNQHDAVINSKVWRWAWPIHTFPSQIGSMNLNIGRIANAIKLGGGLWPTAKTTISVLRSEGLAGIRWRMRNMDTLERQSIGNGTIYQTTECTRASAGRLIPYFLDPALSHELIEVDYARQLTLYLRMPSVSQVINAVEFLEKIGLKFNIIVEGDPLSFEAMSAIFSERKKWKHLVDASIINPTQGLFDALMKTPEAAEYNLFYFDFGKNGTADYFAELLGDQAGEGGALSRVWNLLETGDQAFVFAQGLRPLFENLPATQQRLIEDFVLSDLGFELKFEFNTRVSEVGLYFSASRRLQDIVRMITAHSNTCKSVVDYLLPEILSLSEGDTFNFLRAKDEEPAIGYEPQKDYSLSTSSSDIKVLCYYLPQFHYTPENDLWHGPNFTEWTKVRGATPLFEGHYQQHVPHVDIGYYLLTSPEVLQRQADQMKKAGVHGQVFYHYWFTGRMILEKPARMLLENEQVEMPFCFCWANENWTRRWDGNEREILLGQNYSREDAQAFIEYLIPFFKDRRYITVDGRPVFSIYRPSSIPDIAEYIQVWNRACLAAGLKEPYLVATLTRGALDPNEFMMDAGVERVLHDWTDGRVPNIASELEKYWPVNGSVLSYEGVSQFYAQQKDAKPFTYFRSIVPAWDNTARYGTQALVVHDSKPQLFESWFREITHYTKTNLPNDRQFVFVNAWNEWAEGAHLEPDSKYGYAYLNAIGRVLSEGHTLEENDSPVANAGTKCIHLELSKDLIKKLEDNRRTKERFSNSVSKSSIFEKFDVSSNYAFDNEAQISSVRSDAVPDGIVIRFNDACIFDALALEQLVAKAESEQGVIVPFVYGSNSRALSEGLKTTIAQNYHQFPIAVSTKFGCDITAMVLNETWCFQILPDTIACNEFPAISTIVRFHKSANINELRSAISCLNAMQNCNVQVIVAAQDLSEQQNVALRVLLESFSWPDSFKPVIRYFTSPDGSGDLRSKMLNDSLKAVATRYAAFLDYDDLLFAGAYSWLASRMKHLGKAIGFGRVYSTEYNSSSHVLIARKKSFEYGFSYSDFVACNHAPLHSFLLDLERINLNEVVHYDSQKYMEDYLLTLQIFSKYNGDWDGLRLNYYIGDYLHSVDREHTLALNDNEERNKLRSDTEYMVCLQRIQALQLAMS